MALYLIYFNQQWVGDHTEEWFLGRVAPSTAVVDEMEEAGVLVFAGGLEDGPVFHSDDTSGTLSVSDGPYAGATEVLGGLTVVDVADETEARRWAGKVAVGCGWPQEVRPFFPGTRRPLSATTAD